MNSLNKTGRFAPSPSGRLHMGNISSLLLAWLDIKSRGGEIIFRLEDLDPERSRMEFSEAICADMKYLGLSWDTGYFGIINEYCQSQRENYYKEAFDKLSLKGLVYPCFCSRSDRLSGKKCRCAQLKASEAEALIAAGHTPSWKVKVPDREIDFVDGHYGKISENLADTGDFIIKRSDGVYAYQLAVSVDDMSMGVNRVVRGRDILSSTVRQIWLIETLGGTAPEYCHAPLIVSGGSKLSKRFGDTSMEYYRENYSAEEILGYLSHLLYITDSPAPISAAELVNRFDWSVIPANDIYI